VQCSLLESKEKVFDGANHFIDYIRTLAVRVESKMAGPGAGCKLVKGGLLGVSRLSRSRSDSSGARPNEIATTRIAVFGSYFDPRR